MVVLRMCQAVFHTMKCKLYFWNHCHISQGPMSLNILRYSAILRHINNVAVTVVWIQAHWRQGLFVINIGSHNGLLMTRDRVLSSMILDMTTSFAHHLFPPYKDMLIGSDQAIAWLRVPCDYQIGFISVKFDIIMVTSSNGNISCVIGLRLPVNSPHTQSDAELWCFLWSAPWINGWVNNRETCDLRRHPAHYDVIVIRYE